MFISHTVARFLEDRDVDYDVKTHDKTFTAQSTAEVAHVPGDALAKGVVLKSGEEFWMAVVPATHEVDETSLASMLGVEGIELAEEEELPYIFRDCELGAIPPLGHAYGIETIVDSALLGQQELWFEAGSHEHLVHLRANDFRRLMAGCPRAPISHHI
ncbi:MAG: YbaK/EbsC family protein [Myxococcales bacterium]|jgi:Ala-tRNA(Pro) deacylase|nr:YbaK/EbsC family protein [Myxococcales bacterium]